VLADAYIYELGENETAGRGLINKAQVSVATLKTVES
jgi:hypothetical protein